MNYQELIKPLEIIIKDAGDILLTYFNKNNLERFDKPDGSFATQADLESEKFLIAKLHELVPEAGFFTEETGIKNGNNEYLWVIDPLDGTTNFAQGLPYFCISIALTKNNIPVVGVVYNPLLQEFFYALKGAGAFLITPITQTTHQKVNINHQTLNLNNHKSLKNSVILFSVPYKKNMHFFDEITSIAHQAYSVRTLGAAALDQAYVAAGRGDAVVMQGLSWWDVAAGMLLITEAGGIVTDFKGEEITPKYQTFLGGISPLYDELRVLVKT
ncbi:inositol monophosphatase [bacterium]|nr:inositol monophosphatase [bacterium]